MPKIFWSDQAYDAYEALATADRSEVDRHLALLRHFPGLYQRIESGRYRGRHRFLVRDRLHVIYAIMGESDDCYIIAIRPARSRSE
jgi:hypothetical protein